MCRFAAAAILAWLLAGIGSLPAAAEAKPMPRQAREIVGRLLNGKPVLEEGITIRGDLEFGQEPVRAAFVCRRCTLTGSIRASHARFERGIDLSGSVVRGDVDFNTSVFSEAALFGATGDEPRARAKKSVCKPADRVDRAGASFGGTVNFSFATFKDIADFEGVAFCSRADFTSTRFRAAGRYGGAYFGTASIFRAASFHKEAFFERAFLAAPVDFRNTTFEGGADFREATFACIDEECRKTVSFDEAVFRERADFSRTITTTRAVFRNTNFGADAVFRRANFALPVSFESAIVAGRLELGGATLMGSAQFLLMSAKELSLDETMFVPLSGPFKIDAQGLSAGDIVAKIDAIELIPQTEIRERLLRVLETSAKERGDLRLANDAHFRLQELAARGDWLPWRLADYAFYRTVAGYFVRPLYPLAWLAGVVFLATVIRVFRPRPRSEAADDDEPARDAPSADAESAEKPRDNGAPDPDAPDHPLSLAGRFVDAFALTITGRREPSPLRRAELLVYAVLLACFLIAVANANPTLRDMIETVT